MLAHIAACAPVIDNRGYVFEDERLAQLQRGITPRAEVEALLGVPSARSPIDNKTIYYICSHYVTHTVFKPKETDRYVMAIRFDDEDKISTIVNYELEDGVVVAYSKDATQTQGSTLSAVQQILGNFGQFGGSGGRDF